MSVLLDGRRPSSASPEAPNEAPATAQASEPAIPVPHLDATASAAAVLQAALAQAASKLIVCDGRMRDPEDTDAVHDARVAVRRLRSHLSTFMPLLDRAWARSLRDRLSSLDEVLGQARSADVLLEKLEQTAQRLDAAERSHADELLRIFRERRPAAHERLRAALSENAHRQLLDALVEAGCEPRCSRRASEPANDWTSQLMERVWRKARKRVRNAQAPPSDRNLHRIRIASKHLRYASEAFEPTQGKAASRYAKRAERLQITLGEQHDAVEVRAQLRSTDLSAEARSVAEELAERLDAQARRLRGKWRPLWNALREHRFWD